MLARRVASLSVVAMTVLSGLVILPAGTGAPPPAPFSCALRVAPDGSLYHTSVNFSLPDISNGREPVSGRGIYCTIINNSGRSIPAETVRSLDENFTLYIWPNDTAAFGTPPYSKINIIITTQDGTGGVAGYFSPSDPDAIYLDYDDLSLDLDVTAHEFQHLIHNSKDPYESTWLNEGCSETGIYVCYGGGRPGLTQHFAAYGLDTDNDFTYWDTVSDYGGAGLWTIYCYEHYGGGAFTKALVADQARGIQSYDDQLAFKAETFGSVFKRWVVANWLNNHSVEDGRWGYTGVWNYVGHTMLFKTYPMTCSSAVSQANGADYIRFEPAVWNVNGGDLELNVTFNSGTGYCAVAKVGRSGTGTADAAEVPAVSGNRATMLVPNLGGDCSVAGLVLSGLSGPCTYAFTAELVDRTPPNTTLSSVPYRPNGKNGWFVVLQPKVTLASNENSTTYFHWDSSADSPVSGTIPVPEGGHTISYHSVDIAGNVEPEKNRTFKVDLTPPNTSCVLGPAPPDGLNGWYRSPATVSLVPDSAGTNLSCSWDGAPLTNYTGPLEVPQGVHRFNYRGEDPAGNLEVTKFIYTRLDTEAPTVEVNVTPSVPDGQNGWYIATPHLNLSSADFGSPVIHYRWDDGNETAYTGELEPPYGAHTLRCHAVDEAGNRGPNSTFMLKFDPVAPVVSAVTDIPGPDGLDGWFRSQTNLTLTADEAVPVAIHYKWDGGSDQTYGGPILVPEGAHTIYYYGVDEAGNRGPELSMGFKLDTIPPSTMTEISPGDLGNAWYHDKPGLELQTEPGSYISYSLDNGTFRQYSKPFEIGDGITYLTFFATDPAGNSETPTVRRFRVDTTPPRISLNLSRTNMTTNDEVNITISAEDQNGIQDYLYDYGDGTTSSWTRFGNCTRRYPAPGIYYIKVRVRDGSGLEGESGALSLNVTSPPKKHVPPPPTISDYIAAIPTYVYYAAFAVVSAAFAGAAVRAVMKSRRRRKLYLEVERAEQARERRHTMHFDEEAVGGYHEALSTAQSESGHGLDATGEPRAFRGFTPGAFEGGQPTPDIASPVEPPGPEKSEPGELFYGKGGPQPTDQRDKLMVGPPGADVPPYSPAPPMDTEERTEPFFDGVKVIQPRQEEVVYKTEIGASRPIWARGGKTGPEPRKRAGMTVHSPEGGEDARSNGVDDLPGRLNRDNT
jgi:hypothetical protein